MVYLLLVAKATLLPTGLSSLDSFLGGGWPTGGLTEILGNEGGGKTLLALRAISSLTRKKRWVAIISRGESLFPPAMAAEGVDLPYLLWLRPPQVERCRWGAEQVVRSGLFPLVLIYEVSYDERNARRLQLTSEKTGGTVLFLTSRSGEKNPWAFTLRLRVERVSLETIRIQILRGKRSLCKLSTEVSLNEKLTDRVDSIPLSPAQRIAS
jgi:hypothetical protein